MMQVTTDKPYTASFSVDRIPEEAYAAVNDPRAWWSQEITGVTDQVGAEFQHRFQDVHRCTLRVTELVPGRRVVWHVLDNYFNFIDDQGEWRGTDIVFDISETADGAEVRFTHVGLTPQDECYDVCSNAWGGYLDGSLKSLITTGTGRPNPKEGGQVPDHQDTARVERAKRPTRHSA